MHGTEQGSVDETKEDRSRDSLFIFQVRGCLLLPRKDVFKFKPLCVCECLRVCVLVRPAVLRVHVCS